MIRLEVQGETWNDILFKIHGLVPPTQAGLTAADVVAISETARLKNATHDALDPTQPDDAEEKLIAAGASPEFAKAQVATGAKRGRKPGSKNTKPAASQAPADQPAVSNNTGISGGGASTALTESETASPVSEPSDAALPSAPEKTAAVADAGSPPADATADLSSEITFDEFKKRLNDRAGGDGLRHITAALNEHGYAKVKEVKPEDYAKVLSKCDELTA